MAKDSTRNENLGCLYGICYRPGDPPGADIVIEEYPIIKRTPKRIYFGLAGRWRKNGQHAYADRAALERDGKVTIPGEGWPATISNVLYSSRPPPARKPARTAAVVVTTPPPASTDSGRNEDGGAEDLWQKLQRADWSSSAAAYATAADARRIIAITGMTLGAFAAECRARRISGFGSQASVSRRLRWAELHDELWNAGILPRNVFISEAASRPLFDGKLTTANRLKLLAELFGPHMTDEAKRALAEELNEALMREHLKRQGQDGGDYKAPRTLVPEKVIARLLAQGVTADQISDIAKRLEDSARNQAGQ